VLIHGHDTPFPSSRPTLQVWCHRTGLTEAAGRDGCSTVEECQLRQFSFRRVWECRASGHGTPFRFSNLKKSKSRLLRKLLRSVCTFWKFRSRMRSDDLDHPVPRPALKRVPGASLCEGSWYFGGMKYRSRSCSAPHLPNLTRQPSRLAPDKVSSACRRQQHSSCSSLRCGCECHARIHRTLPNCR